MKSKTDQIKSLSIWLEDHWWIAHRNRRYRLFEDPLTGDMVDILSAKKIQLQRNAEGVIVRPPLINPHYDDGSCIFTTSIIDCPECDSIGCIICFKTGYLYKTERNVTRVSK